MITEITEGIFRIPLELPDNSLREVNTYLIKGSDKSLLIDTGLNHERSKNQMLSALKSLGVALEDVDIFLTHSHPDHSGLAERLLRPNTKVYISHTVDRMMSTYGHDCLRQDLHEAKQVNTRPHYYPIMVNQKMIDISPSVQKVLSCLKDGDTLNYGGYDLQFLETPGHCDDHGCLYDGECGLLFCGDLVLDRLSPMIFEMDIEEGNLNKYFKSLKRVYPLNVQVLCPAHGGSFDFQSRIEELYESHEARLLETFNALKKAPSTVEELAPKLCWHFADGDWYSFPRVHKEFTFGRVLSYLDYLCYRRMAGVKRDNEGNLRFFTTVEHLPEHIVEPL